MIIICAGSGNSCECSPLFLVVHIFHVRGVVVIRNNDCSSAVSSRDHDQEIPLIGLPKLVCPPPTHPWKLEIGLPSERHISSEGFAMHALTIDGLPVICKQPLPERFQIAFCALPEGHRWRVMNAVRIVLCEKAAG